MIYYKLNQSFVIYFRKLLFQKCQDRRIAAFLRKNCQKFLKKLALGARALRPSAEPNFSKKSFYYIKIYCYRIQK